METGHTDGSDLIFGEKMKEVPGPNLLFSIHHQSWARVPDILGTQANIVLGVRSVGERGRAMF